MHKAMLSLITLALLAQPTFAQDSPGMAAYKKALARQEAARAQKVEEGLKLKEQTDRLEGEAAEQAAEQEAISAEKQKRCGADYGEIRVGMKLARVQDCFGEVFLHGQLKTSKGVVDEYTRGNVWLYVQKGRVVAWGE